MSNIFNWKEFNRFLEQNRASKGILLKTKAGGVLFKVCRALLLFGLCFLILQPLLDKLSIAFMALQDLYDPTVISIPRHFTLDNFALASQLMNFFPTLFRTLVLVVVSATLQIAACTLTGYGFARFKFPLKNFWFACVMLIIVVPPQTIMAPLYLNFRFFDVFGFIRRLTGKPINMLNSVAGYLLLSVTGMGLKSGLYIFMLRQFFRSMPKELEEAACIDGCGKLRTFGAIILPDAAPMVTSCFLFSFVWQWTDSFYSSLFLTTYRVLAAQLGAVSDRLSEWWGQSVGYASGALPPVGYMQAIIATGMLMSLIPIIILYLIAQKAFVQSLSRTGITGM
ncbi:MAG: carbohydrate ABC transporter permease [Treponema sp.]|nr:carbohydrate ABC transporter permease [Treponema sp.]